MGVWKLNFGLPLVARKTVWVYRVFRAKIETKPQKKIHTRLKQSFFFLFIYLFIIIIIILLLLLFRQSNKNQRENFFIFLFFLCLFWKKQIIIIYSIIYLAGRNWVLTVAGARQQGENRQAVCSSFARRRLGRARQWPCRLWFVCVVFMQWCFTWIRRWCAMSVGYERGRFVFCVLTFERCFVRGGT